jgi:HemY protein
LIRQVLKYRWQGDLVELYGKLPFNNINRQLIIVNAWLKMYGQRPELLLLLGNLCVREQLWGKAKDYYEKCLMQGPNAQASLDYGRLLEQLGETDAAMQKYRDGLAQIKI